MRHEDDRARVLHQGFKQHVFGAQVEVVGGLIEQQEVGGVQQHLEQRVAVALASGKNADALEHIVSGKKKTAEQAAQLGLRGGCREFSKVVEDASFRIEFFVLILREIVGLDVVAQLVFAGGERLLAGQQFNQSGLSCSVDSHQRDALTALDHEIYFLENLVLINATIAVALSDIRELGNDAPARFRLRKRKADGLLFFRNFDPLHFFELFNAALHLLGFGGRIAEAVDKHFKLFDAVGSCEMRTKA